MFKYFLGLTLSIGLLSFNNALAYSNVACEWDPSSDLTADLGSVANRGVSWGQENYDCRKDEDGQTYCKTRDYWIIPNKTFSISESVKLICVNFGEETEQLRFGFIYKDDFSKVSKVWKDPTMKISGAGPTLKTYKLDEFHNQQYIEWAGANILPCKTDCGDINTASPRYISNLTFTFTVRPKVFKLTDRAFPQFDLQDSVGNILVLSGSLKEATWSTIGNSYLSLCGLNANLRCNITPDATEGGSGGGSGWNKPPIKQCTLTIVTPDVVAFQPISSDDLSRGRVRTEDFTLTAIKGPDQSTPCMGSTYNLPGEIKTQGGYSISSTLWGISHSSGAPQGIGLKLYDLGKGDYLRFNYQYASFIRDISSISESKRIRAEISATTKDLKKIKDGAYSQVLTFEVKMP